MKHIIKYLVLSTVLFMLITSCDKTDTLATSSSGYNGSAPVLSSSVKSVAVLAADSLKSVFVLNWTSPKYATNSKTVSYTIQIDSSGRNFAKAVSFKLTGVLTDTFSAKTLNNILIGFGFNYRVAYNVDIRVISAYGNNNEQLTSNTIVVSMTPYVTPPKITPPASGTLFIVGDATAGGWTNPVPVPTQQFYQIDSVTYGGVFNLIGGNAYLLLPVNGDWNHKYGGVSTSGGPLLVDGDVPGTNTVAPATSGYYKIIVDFQHGTYSVTPYTSTFPTNLYIVGDATADGWSNSNPPVNPVFTQLNAAQFQLTIPLVGGKNFLMLPVAGSWTNKYAIANATVPSSGGSFGYNLSTNFNAPATSGTYTITANFLDFTYTVK